MIDHDELVLLQDIGASSERVTNQIHSILSSRVNSYLVLLSLVSLAEATLAAALISKAVNFPVASFIEGAGFGLILLSFIFLGQSIHVVYSVFHKKLAMYLVAEEPELPYLSPDYIGISIDDFSYKQLDHLFEKPLREQNGYKDVDKIYRKWIFQKAQTAIMQHGSIAVVGTGLKNAQRWLASSVITLMASAAILALGKF